MFDSPENRVKLLEQFNYLLAKGYEFYLGDNDTPLLFEQYLDCYLHRKPVTLFTPRNYKMTAYVTL